MAGLGTRHVDTVIKSPAMSMLGKVERRYQFEAQFAGSIKRLVTHAITPGAMPGRIRRSAALDSVTLASAIRALSAPSGLSL